MSKNFKERSSLRKSKNLNIEQRLSERRFSNLNFMQINKQWAVVKEAKNTISILNKMKSEEENQTESKIRKLEKLESSEIGVIESDSDDSDGHEIEFNMLRYHA